MKISSFGLILAINLLYLIVTIEGKAPPGKLPADPRIIFYHGDTMLVRQPYKLHLLKDVLAHPDFDNTKPTVLYMNDCYESFDESVAIIVNAYLTRRDHNILVLDWSTFRQDDYFEFVIPNMKKLSYELAEHILNAGKAGLKWRKLHLVGFSLGAHLAGLAGRAINEKTNGTQKLVRISALDPSNGGFNDRAKNSNYVPGISKFDAEFIDIIHTDTGFLGSDLPSECVEFFPNFGHRTQPGCKPSNVYMKEGAKNDLCNHKRACDYWAESVTSTKKDTFLAVEAKNFQNFRNGALNLSKLATMGLNCTLDTISGYYYLQTNPERPYSRGVAGLIFTDLDEPKPQI